MGDGVSVAGGRYCLRPEFCSSRNDDRRATQASRAHCTPLLQILRLSTALCDVAGKSCGTGSWRTAGLPFFDSLVARVTGGLGQQTWIKHDRGCSSSGVATGSIHTTSNESVGMVPTN